MAKSGKIREKTKIEKGTKRRKNFAHTLRVYVTAANDEGLVGVGGVCQVKIEPSKRMNKLQHTRRWHKTNKRIHNFYFISTTAAAADVSIFCAM